jgi:hypothetical protein
VVPEIQATTTNGGAGAKGGLTPDLLTLSFYQQRPPDAATGSILVAAVDGKGIPVVKPVSPQPALRLTKGQKTNKKRMRPFAAGMIHSDPNVGGWV